MQFLVRHVPAGSDAVLQQTLQADSAEALRNGLAAQGSVVLEVQPARGMAGGLAGARTVRLDVAWWCRELETLVRAGMTAVEAIQTLAATRQDGSRDTVHATLLQALHEGASLSRAMRSTGAFPAVLVAGVTASERTSTLADALRDYLHYAELLDKLRRQAVSAALYPAMVVGLGGVVAVFLLLYVIPRFSAMYAGMHGNLSFSTELVLGLSLALRQAWPVLLAVLAGAAVLGWRAMRSGRLQALAGQVVDAVPPLHRQADHYRLAKLYQSMAMLFRGGYTLDEALQVCSGLSLGARMDRGVAIAREQIARGKPASAAMATAGLTDLTTQRLLVVGERTGAFDSVLQTVADRHAQVFTTFVDRAAKVVEPVLLLAVALVVGGLVIMMYMPIFDIAGGLGAGR